MTAVADVTIVVPVHNGQEHLQATLDSLYGQTDVAIEVLVVDDGSKDGSFDVAEGHPGRPRIVRQANLGVAAARNRGLAEASASWVAFVDQDDLWHPERTRVLLDLAHDTGRKMVATTEEPFAVADDREALNAVGDGRESWPRHYVRRGHEMEDLLRRHQLPAKDTCAVEILGPARFLHSPATLTTAFLFDRQSAISAGGCATFVRALDDHILYVNLSRLLGGAARIDLPMLYYRVHAKSVTTTSPMVAPYLSALLALRWGRVFDADPSSSDYVDHLISQLPISNLSRAQQLSILTLSVPAARRHRYMARWAKQTVRREAERRGLISARN